LSSLFQNGKLFRLALTVLYDADYKEGAHIVKVPSLVGVPDQCEQELKSRLDQARVIRMSRQQKEQPLSSFRKLFLPNFDLLEKALLDGLAKTDREGLIGEILTEIMIEQCFCNFRIIHRNWRRTGHSNQEGMDFLGVWNRKGNESLALVESKFCGGTAQNFDAYVRARTEEALEGMENYQENEVKLGKAFKWIVEHDLRQPVSVQDYARLFNLFEANPRVNSASVIISLPLNVKLLVQNPPGIVKSAQFQTALAFVDLGDCAFIQRLVEENDSSD
jgi:hypothetical protein